jgi:hypothetical protein
LYSEFEIARWLMHGIAKQDQEIIDDAVSMLEVLADDVATGAVGRLIAKPVSAVATEAKPVAVEDTTTRPIDVSEIPSKTDSELF